MRVQRLKFFSSNRGTAVLELAITLPILLLILIGLVDICLLLDQQLRLIGLSREAANVFSRGAGFQETFQAITNADGSLALDGPDGRVILTRVSIDKKTGLPVITAQQTLGGLAHDSVVGTLPPNASSAPAVIPNRRTIPPGMSLVVAEVYAQRQHFYGQSGLAPGRGAVVLGSAATF